MEHELTKKFYRISDVAELLNLPQSTLRYWECEFSELRPRRNEGNKRLYTATDIELLELIRFLLRDKGLTIEGAREHLKRNRAAMSRTNIAVKRLQQVRTRLVDIIEALDKRQKLLRAERIDAQKRAADDGAR